MGLLDNLFGSGPNDPRTQAMGLLSAGLLRGDFGGGLLAANQHFAQEPERQAQRQMRELQMREAQAKMEDMARGREFLQSLPAPGEGASPAHQLMFRGVQAGQIPIGDYIKSMAPKQLEFGKIDPKDYTPESLRAASQTGDYTQLVPVRKMDVVGGQAVDLYGMKPGTRLDDVDVNKPFWNVGGQVVPNTAYQGYTLRNAHASAPKVAVDLKDPTAVAKAAMGFQNDVRTAFKDDAAVANAYRAMREAVKDPSPQGDTALLYSFFKSLDPASTVREGEIGMVMASRSIPDRFKGMAQKLANGQTLMPNERLDIQKQAERNIAGRIPRAKSEVKAYRENAGRLGIDPNLYVPDPYEGISFGQPNGGNGGGGNALQDAARAELARRNGGR